MGDIYNSKSVFDRNIKRVQGLVKHYHFLKAKEIRENNDYKFTDVLRSAVVMLHSSFEEYFRSVLCDILPQKCNVLDLKNFSFLGSNGKNIPKIELGDLLKWQDLTVNELLTQSIQEELNKTSFNDFRDIAIWCGKAKIDISQFNQQEKLNEVIKRRHKIVHEADNSKSDDKYAISPIRENIVNEWINIVCNLVDLINTNITKYEEDNNETINL